MTAKTLTVERVFEAAKQTVWQAITDKDLMKLWYFDLPEFKAKVGFKFDFIGGPEEGVQYQHLCEILEVIPEQKLTYSWKYEGYEGISYVTFELFEEEKEKTKLKLTHTGIETFPAAITDFDYHNFEEGWNQIINISLRQFIENN